MKKMIVAAVAAGALLGLPALAQAQSQVYGGVGYSSIGMDNPDVSLGLVQGRLGVDLNDNFAIEGEFGFGVGDDTVAGVDVSANWQFGGFAVIKAPVSESFDVFARLGYVAVEFEASGPGGTATADGNDFAYGIGAQAFFTENDGIRGDWTSYGGDGNVWSISYVRRF